MLTYSLGKLSLLRHRRTSQLDLPPEILLVILALLDGLSHINLAIALPNIFARPGFNIFILDAEAQVRRYRATFRTPMIAREEMLPLLHTAIFHDVEVEVVSRIIQTYKLICPSSIDGIWGELTPAFPPPLYWAAEHGKPGIISLLLDEGADVDIKDATRQGPDAPVSQCCNVSIIHSKCSLGGMIRSGTCCQTCLDRLIGQTYYHARITDRTMHQAHDECAVILYNRGSRPNPRGYYVEGQSKPLHGSLYVPIVAGFTRLVQAILNPVLATLPPQGVGMFGGLMQDALYYAWTSQKHDEENDMIKYLMSLGAALTPPYPGDEAIPVDHTYAIRSFQRGHPITGTLLFNEHTRRRMPLDFGCLVPQRRYELPPIARPLVEVLYDHMCHGSNAFNGRPASVKTLHSELLRAVIYRGTTDSAQFLIDKGVAGPLHLYTAIVKRNMAVCRALLRTQFSVNERIDLPPHVCSDYPLELALKLGHMKTVGFLLREGADPSLLPQSGQDIFRMRYLPVCTRPSPSSDSESPAEARSL